ncbi:zinc finger protein 830 [Aphomia sociella]
MSLRMQMEKKKTQDEMRRLMAERKKKNITPVKIDNPLAKYNNAGQLTCILCKSIVRSENVWTIHVNSKQHRDNVDKAKKLKELTNNFTVHKTKHKLSPSEDAPVEKKLKGILKNAGEALPPVVPKSNNTAPQIVLYHNEEIKRSPLNLGSLVKNEQDQQTSVETQELDSKIQVPEQPIPEGFFDDPILDAKVRNIEYKDPVEEEWERFQKEMKEEASASAEIIAGEQEEATAERQIDEIDEQIRNWSRVLDLEVKKEETKKKKLDMEEQMIEDNDEEDGNEDDIDEFLDWRAKKSYC